MEFNEAIFRLNWQPEEWNSEYWRNRDLLVGYHTIYLQLLLYLFIISGFEMIKVHYSNSSNNHFEAFLSEKNPWIRIELVWKYHETIHPRHFNEIKREPTNESKIFFVFPKWINFNWNPLRMTWKGNDNSKWS